MNKKWHRRHVRDFPQWVQKILLNRDASAAVLRAAIRRDPAIYALHATLASLLIRRDRRRQAMTVWHQTVRRFPSLANPYFQRASWALDLGDFSDAEKYLRLCLQHDHGYFGKTAHFWRAESLCRLARYREARIELAKVPDGYKEHWFLDYECWTKEDLVAKIDSAEGAAA